MKIRWLCLAFPLALFARDIPYVFAAEKAMINQEVPRVSNVEKVQAIVSGIMAGSDAGFKEFISPNLVVSSPVLGLIPTQENPSKMLVEVLAYWKRAFPGVKTHWTDVKEEGERVIVSWTAEAVHNGADFMGIAPHGVHFEYGGTTTYSFKEGKLVQYQADVDMEKIKQILARKAAH